MGQPIRSFSLYANSLFVKLQNFQLSLLLRFSVCPVLAFLPGRGAGSCGLACWLPQWMPFAHHVSTCFIVYNVRRLCFSSSKLIPRLWSLGVGSLLLLVQHFRDAVGEERGSFINTGLSGWGVQGRVYHVKLTLVISKNISFQLFINFHVRRDKRGAIVSLKKNPAYFRIV